VKEIRNLKAFICAIILITFSLVFFESTTEHFFHDVLPEEADGCFLLKALQTSVEAICSPVKFVKSRQCPFNSFLTALEKTSFSSYQFFLKVSNSFSLLPWIAISTIINCLFRQLIARSPPFQS